VWLPEEALSLTCAARRPSSPLSPGKVQLGFKQTLKSIRDGTTQLVIIANNCPMLRKSQIEYYAMLAKTTVHNYAGNNRELGIACGKMYQGELRTARGGGARFHQETSASHTPPLRAASVMSVIDAGDSDILKTL